MLYVFSGSDFVKIKKRVAGISEGHEVVRFGEGGEAFSDVPSRIGTSGLFSAKVALFLDRPLDTAEGREIFLGHLTEFTESDMPVIAVVSGLDAETKKKLPKKNTIVETYDIQEKDKPFQNVFALADAYAKGDRKNAWVLYRKFIEGGSAPEELYGIVSWQVRAFVLASKTKNAAEAGLKPFVYTKAKSAVQKIKNPEETSRELLSLYHQSRSGQGNLGDLLEIFLLKKD